MNIKKKFVIKISILVIFMLLFTCLHLLINRKASVSVLSISNDKYILKLDLKFNIFNNFQELKCIDKGSNLVIWEKKFSSYIRNIDLNDAEFIISGYRITNGKVSGEISKYNVRDGKQILNYSKNEPVESLIWDKNKHYIYLIYQDKIVEINEITGKIIQSRLFQGSSIIGSPGFVNNRNILIMTEKNRNCYNVDIYNIDTLTRLKNIYTSEYPFYTYIIENDRIITIDLYTKKVIYVDQKECITNVYSINQKFEWINNFIYNKTDNSAELFVVKENKDHIIQNYMIKVMLDHSEAFEIWPIE
jgi:hypothetical protein